MVSTSQAHNLLKMLRRVSLIKHKKCIVYYGKKIDDKNVVSSLKEDEGILEIKQNLYKLGNKDMNLKLYTIHFLNEAF